MESQKQRAVRASNQRERVRIEVSALPLQLGTEYVKWFCPLEREITIGVVSKPNREGSCHVQDVYEGKANASW